MTTKTLSGHCLCGAVSYDVDFPFEGRIAHCHCKQCRRQAGSVALTWFTVKKPAFRLTGAPLSSFRSSDHGSRGFCGTCGTPITFQTSRFPDEVDVTLCSLREDQIMPADLNIHTESRLEWLKLDTHLPERRADDD